jgi:uncharacterized repeat protein (TIGR04076 family)
MPTDEEMVKGVKESLGRFMNMTDEDIRTLISRPHNRKLMMRSEELEKYQIVAEVTASKYCSAGLKPGQKFTFNAAPTVLVPSESDGALCVKALGPIADMVMGFWDRILEGVDPNQGMWQIAECLDPGIDRGGLGHAVFKVYCKKVR